MTTKFSEWLNLELPPLPGGQWIPGDDLAVIRGGVPYTLDPVVRESYAEMGGNGSATTINTMNVWESIAGTLVAPSGVEGFTLAANVWTVTAQDSLRPILISAGLTAMKVGSGDDNYEFGIFVNDVMVGVGMAGNLSSTKWQSFYVARPKILNNGDTIEIKVRNRNDNANVVVSDMFFGII
jgi:hypothetical protein